MTKHSGADKTHKHQKYPINHRKQNRFSPLQLALRVCIEFLQFVWQYVVFHHHSVLIQWVIELLHRPGLINKWVIICNWDVLKTSNRPMPGAEMWEQIILRFVARSSFHKNQDRCLPPSRNLLTSTNSLA